QDPETRIQDQSILSMVFIAAAKLDFKILCNYRVYYRLFKFLKYPKVEPTNNQAEQSLR
ncbi:hypothetical protein D1BOALGB6SA_10278, partial [Olavius sp. associated proteobacterium Delta 1]